MPSFYCFKCISISLYVKIWQLYHNHPLKFVNLIYAVSMCGFGKVLREDKLLRWALHGWGLVVLYEVEKNETRRAIHWLMSYDSLTQHRTLLQDHHPLIFLSLPTTAQKFRFVMSLCYYQQKNERIKATVWYK